MNTPLYPANRTPRHITYIKANTLQYHLRNRLNRTVQLDDVIRHVDTKLWAMKCTVECSAGTRGRNPPVLLRVVVRGIEVTSIVCT